MMSDVWKEKIKNNRIFIGTSAGLIGLMLVVIIVVSAIFITDKISSERKEDTTKMEADSSNGRQEESTTEEPTTEAVVMRQFNMDELIDICARGDYAALRHFSNLVKEGNMCYTNFVKENYDNTDTSLTYFYKCNFMYKKREYELQCYYYKPERCDEAGKSPNGFSGVSLMDVASKDSLGLLYDSTSNIKLLDAFLNKSYDINDYVVLDLPHNISLGDYQAMLMDLSDGCSFIGDVDAISAGKYSEAKKQNDYVEGTWDSIGGIVWCKKEQYFRTDFENDKLISAGDYVFWGEECVDGCDMQAVVGEGSYNLLTLPESVEWKEEYGIEPDDMLSYWCVIMAEPDSQYVYTVYLNKRYYTKEDVIKLAKSVDIKENNPNVPADPFWMSEKHSYIIRPGEVKSLHTDIDNDGTDEVIEIFASEPMDPNQFPDTRMRIVDGEKNIFETSNFFVGLSHCSYGNTIYYIVREGGKNYLLQYYTYLWQGADLRSYKLIEFLEDGTNEVVKSGDADLSDTDYRIVENGVYNRVKYTMQFNDDMMKYLNDHKTILVFNLDTDYEDMVYSYDGDIKGADDRFEKDLFAQSTWDFEGETLEERIRALCEYWQKRKEQDSYIGGTA